jgi:Zinc-ribbon containing domain
MKTLPAFQQARRGYSEASPPERGGFGMLSGFWLSIGISRGLNYVRERRRAAPRVRSLGRSVYYAPGKGQARIHHFVPGIAVAFGAGAAAIIVRNDGREAWLGPPFGAGLGLTIDEAAILIKLDNPYWSSEKASLIQAGVAAFASAALGLRFQRRGRAAALTSGHESAGKAIGGGHAVLQPVPSDNAIDRRRGSSMAEPVPAGSDVSAGTYRCTNCGNELEVGSTDNLPPCPSCGNGQWETVSGGDSVQDPYPDR